jgi:class 3 adenylate cyclase
VELGGDDVAGRGVVRRVRGEELSEIPETKYLRVGDYHLAYQVFGQGPPDLLLKRPVGNHLELQWDDPNFASYLRGLASFSRVIVFDARGDGLSDPVSGDAWPGLEERTADTVAVLDALEAREVIVVSIGPSFIAVSLAAAHPERVTALVLSDPSVSNQRDDDWPYGRTEEEWRDRDYYLSGASPQLAEWLRRYLRISLSRGAQRVLSQSVRDADVRQILPVVRVPTLVIEHMDAERPGRGRYVADRIPGARLHELPGRAVYGWRFDDPERVVEVIHEFVTGEKRTPSTDRVLATILFTDVVGSTSRTAKVGDRRWTQTLDAFDEFARRQVVRFGGTLVKSTGDGHLATFDSPGRAIMCACAMRDGVGRFEIELRAGLHTGEIEKRGEDVGGLAVSIARRVCDESAAAEVLVSGSVPPLVAGSGLEFEERGEHELKGVPGKWAIYAVRS